MLRTRFIFALLLLCAALASAFLLSAAQQDATTATQQDPTANFAAQPSTSERLKKPAWWPTKHTAAAEAYAGTDACASCHRDIAATQKMAEMARTAAQAAQSPILGSKPTHDFKVEQYAYKLTANPPSVTVSEGKQSIHAPLEWAIGSGAIGQVYFAGHDNTTYETQFTYYPDIHAFDTTTAHARVPSSLDAALGKQLSNSDVRKCFTCHSTAMTPAEPFDPHKLTPGVHCEACHGPGADHAQAMKRNDDNGRYLIFNTKQLPPADQVDFCGACHKSAVDIASEGVSGVATVRFPAYRLEMSRCWGTSGDRRIVCSACHDPHKPLEHELASYDKNCLSCHQNRSAAGNSAAAATGSVGILLARASFNPQSSGANPTAASGQQTASSPDHHGKACPVATSNCASCHMPKYELPDTHHRFTDHRIRIARDGDPYPD